MAPRKRDRGPAKAGPWPLRQISPAAGLTRPVRRARAVRPAPPRPTRPGPCSCGSREELVGAGGDRDLAGGQGREQGQRLGGDPTGRGGEAGTEAGSRRRGGRTGGRTWCACGRPRAVPPPPGSSRPCPARAVRCKSSSAGSRSASKPTTIEKPKAPRSTRPGSGSPSPWRQEIAFACSYGASTPIRIAPGVSGEGAPAARLASSGCGGPSARLRGQGLGLSA